MAQHDASLLGERSRGTRLRVNHTREPGDRWPAVLSSLQCTRRRPWHSVRHPQGSTDGWERAEDPEEWTTGMSPTAAQSSYLRTLCDEAGEPTDGDADQGPSGAAY